MAFRNRPEMLALLSSGHIFSDHVGMSGNRIRRVGPIQYAVHWLYGVCEPTILRLVDWVLSQKVLTKTRFFRPLLKAVAAASRYFPHGVVVTTEAAGNLVDFIVNTEGPKGARLAVGPCVCQAALNRWKEPIKKDLVVLYGADIYYHLNRGYELISADQAKTLLHECHRAGLVHAVEFCFQSGRWTFVVCNCDTEICAPTRVYLLTGKFHYAGPEVARHDPEKCLGADACGRCLQRCIYGANRIAGDAVRYDAEACMGCGLCVSTCTGRARHMTERRDYRHNQQIPATVLLGPR